ncbi:hypothetical protein ACFL3U_04970, partial [Pseudomonadota bacterium]
MINLNQVPKWLFAASFTGLVILVIVLFVTGKELRYKDGFSFRAPALNDQESDLAKLNNDIKVLQQKIESTLKSKTKSSAQLQNILDELIIKNPQWDIQSTDNAGTANVGNIAIEWGTSKTNPKGQGQLNAIIFSHKYKHSPFVTGSVIDGSPGYLSLNNISKHKFDVMVQDKNSVNNTVIMYD